jgi:hypothetical protein
MKRSILSFIILSLIFISGCGDSNCEFLTDDMLNPLPDCESMSLPGWAKVNTHTHTCLSDGALSPDSVIRWYSEHCYDALSITDHHLWYENNDADIVIIPGNEASSIPHYTLLNYGDIKILNHPNYLFDFTVANISNLPGVDFFEVYNQGVNNDGIEAEWDAVLESGRIMYGIASDDAHFNESPFEVGKAWIMVKADKITQGDILTAIAGGDFYASTGVYLSEYSVHDEYVMTIDYSKTDAIICGFELIRIGDFQRGKVSCIKADGSDVQAWGQPVKRPDTF